MTQTETQPGGPGAGRSGGADSACDRTGSARPCPRNQGTWLTAHSVALPVDASRPDSQIKSKSPAFNTGFVAQFPSLFPTLKDKRRGWVFALGTRTQEGRRLGSLSCREPLPRGSCAGVTARCKQPVLSDLGPACRLHQLQTENIRKKNRIDTNVEFSRSFSLNNTRDNSAHGIPPRQVEWAVDDGRAGQDCSGRL